jgi:hypothetical protein
MQTTIPSSTILVHSSFSGRTVYEEVADKNVQHHMGTIAKQQQRHGQPTNSSTFADAFGEFFLSKELLDSLLLQQQVLIAGETTATSEAPGSTANDDDLATCTDDDEDADESDDETLLALFRQMGGHGKLPQQNRKGGDGAEMTARDILFAFSSRRPRAGFFL